MSKPTSKKQNNTSKQQYRADNQTLLKIANEIKKMFINLHSSDEICSHIQEKYNKSNSVVRGYLRKALDDYKQVQIQDVDAVRLQNQHHLLMQYRKMLDLHDKTGNNKYITHAISFYNLYLKLYPNELQPLVAEQEGNINITFNKVVK